MPYALRARLALLFMGSAALATAEFFFPDPTTLEATSTFLPEVAALFAGGKIAVTKF